MLTASRRIDKCPTPGQRFYDKLFTTRTDKMTNARQMPEGWGVGTFGIDRAISNGNHTFFSIEIMCSLLIAYSKCSECGPNS